MKTRTSNPQGLTIGMDKFEDRSEAELLRLAQAGDESAFLVLYGRLKTGIFRYAFFMTNSKSAAEEVTQEVFISLLRDGGRYSEGLGDVAGFAFGIARNLVRRIGRRERPYRPLPGSEREKLPASLVSGPENMPGQLIRSEVIASVRAAIASLPEHYRQVVVLCDLCELSYAEAASRLGCAVGTIRSRLSRGHALLAQKLKLLGKSQPELREPGTEECLI
jgi:RNA polymerase sigma-70 factor (ECF subfamily)